MSFPLPYWIEKYRSKTSDLILSVPNYLCVGDDCVRLLYPDGDVLRPEDKAERNDLAKKVFERLSEVIEFVYRYYDKLKLEGAPSA